VLTFVAMFPVCTEAGFFLWSREEKSSKEKDVTKIPSQKIQLPGQR